MGRKKKGFSIIIEQVMLFSISVAIFLISFTVFTIYQNYFISVNTSNQLDQVTEWVSSSILGAARTGSSNSSHTISIPRYLENAVYEVELSQTGLEVRNLLNGDSRNSTLYALNETFSLSGTVNSLKGRLTIKKELDKIIIT